MAHIFIEGDFDSPYSEKEYEEKFGYKYNKEPEDNSDVIGGLLVIACFILYMVFK